MEDNIIKIKDVVCSNSSIEDIYNSISSIVSEQNSSNMVEKCVNYLVDNNLIKSKWKNNSPNNQVVLFGDNYVYKIYVLSQKESFLSEIRHAFANVYQELGIDWQIKTVYSNGSLIDIEKREILDVIHKDFSPDILINYNKVLRKVEKRLHFDKLKETLINYGLTDLDEVKLIRQCANKSIDYAMYKSQVILLDDADFFIALLSKNGKPLTLEPITDIKITINNNRYSLVGYHIASNIYNLRKDKVSEPSYKFYLIECDKDDSIKNIVESLKNSFEKELEDNIEILYADDCKEIDINNNIERETTKVYTEEDLLYMNNIGRKSFQWELWQYCNSLCTFCYLGKENRVHNKERQIKSILDLNKAIDNLDFTKYNNISLIGGEFFQGQLEDPDIHYLFFETIKKIFNLYLNKKIGSIWITATLTIGKQQHLYELLDLAKKMGVMPNHKYGSSGLWLCTSWDAEGRFHTQQMLNNWEYHMQNIYKLHNWVKFNTTIILTKPFIDMYLNNNFSMKTFMNTFHTTLFFKQSGIPSGIQASKRPEESFDEFWLRSKQFINNDLGFEMFPKRKDFIKFLNKCHLEDPEVYDRLFNIKYRSDELHRNFNNKEADEKIDRIKDGGPEENMEVLPCGHVYNYAAYGDNNKCCICDRNSILD